MANTTTKGKWVIDVLFDGATAWDMADHYAEGLCIESLEFKPTATDDLIIVKETSATGPRLFDVKAATAYDSKIKYFNTEKSMKKFILHITGVEASSGARLIITVK